MISRGEEGAPGALCVRIRAGWRGGGRPVLRGPEPGRGPGGRRARRPGRTAGARPGQAEGVDLLRAAHRDRRADLLESAAGHPGSFDRTHHHPRFTGWNPNRRVFVRELSDDPLGWLGTQLADLNAMLATGGFPADTAGPDDAENLRRAAPEIMDATRRLLDGVRSGELGNPPRGESTAAGSSA